MILSISIVGGEKLVPQVLWMYVMMEVIQTLAFFTGKTKFDAAMDRFMLPPSTPPSCNYTLPN